MKSLNKVLIIIFFATSSGLSQNKNIQEYFKKNAINSTTYEVIFALNDFLVILNKDSIIYNSWIKQEKKYIRPTEKVDIYYNNLIYKVFFDSLTSNKSKIAKKILHELYENYTCQNISKDELNFLLNYVTDETFVQQSLLFTVLIFKKEEYYALIDNNQKLKEKYIRWLKNPYPLGKTAEVPKEMQERWKKELLRIFKKSKYKIANESTNKINW